VPIVNHGGGQLQIGGNFLRRLFVEDFAEQFVRLHGGNMEKRGALGKREPAGSKNRQKLSLRAGGDFGWMVAR